MVKMVDVEFSMDASDDTMAAVNAANARPLRPVGKNWSNHGYALSASEREGMFWVAPSPSPDITAGSFTITNAAMPGSTTTSGKINLRPAAKRMPR